MSMTGENPTKGAYACARCGKVVFVDERNDTTLPLCPRCNHSKFLP